MLYHIIGFVVFWGAMLIGAYWVTIITIDSIKRHLRIRRYEKNKTKHHSI